MRRGFGRGRRGPGLLGTVARTAVVAGTATAVAGRVDAAQQAAAQRQQEGAAAQEQLRQMQLQAQIDSQVDARLTGAVQAAPPQAAPAPARGVTTRSTSLLFVSDGTAVRVAAHPSRGVKYLRESGMSVR